MNKPYATDWKFINKDTEYSEELQLYYKDSKVYDELSAKHNGIIGMGLIIKNIIKDKNINK